MPNMTNAQLKAALKKAEADRDAAIARADAASEEADAALRIAERYQDSRPGDADAYGPDDVPVGSPELREPELMYDPFDAQNPHKFLRHPQGMHLGWINPVYRDRHRTWRGWTPVEYTDDIGRTLDRYLQDPPRRMEHAVDNFVRRGDAMLCWLPENIWQFRQNKRIERANRGLAPYADSLKPDTGFTRRDIEGVMGDEPGGSIRGRAMHG